MTEEKKKQDVQDPNEEQVDIKTHGTMNCPDCGTPLQKCLIQQNYAMVLCPNQECSYPFNQNEIIENLVHIEETEVLEVARKRLSRN